MLPRANSYEALVEAFRWSMPERFNIATACCERWAAAVPDRVALVGRDVKGGESTVTFAELKHRSDRLAHAFDARGVTAGDRVALLLPQSSEAVVGHFAAYKLGAIVVPLAVLFGPDALRYRLRDSGAKAILTDGAGVAKLAEISGDIPELETVLCVDGPTSGAEGYAEATEPFDAPFPTIELDAGRSGDDDIHLGHHGPAQGRAAWAPGAARPPARHLAYPRIRAAAGRPGLDAVRLGLGRRSAQCAPPGALFRYAGGVRAVPAASTRHKLSR